MSEMLAHLFSQKSYRAALKVAILRHDMLTAKREAGQWFRKKGLFTGLAGGIKLSLWLLDGTHCLVPFRAPSTCMLRDGAADAFTEHLFRQRRRATSRRT